MRRNWLVQPLCPLDSVSDGTARGFTVPDPEGRVEIFVLRRGPGALGYVNSCPHVGTPLDIIPDQFLTADRRHFLCRTHGALFRLEDGHCVAGPCKGKSLEPVPVRVEAGQIVLGGRTK